MTRIASSTRRWLTFTTALFLAMACGGKADTAPTGVKPSDPSAPVNLLRNPSLDTAATASAPLGWSRKSSGSPAPTFSYPVAGRTGSAAAVTLAARTGGDQRWQHESVAITAGTVYTVSIWYKSTTATGVSVEYTTAGGSTTYDLLDFLPATNGVWTQYTTTFTPPPLRTRMSVYHWINSAGTLTVDDAWLVTGRNTPPGGTGTTPDTLATVTPGPDPAPTIAIRASPAAITTGQSSTITWTSTNTTACTASGAWSGVKATAGNEIVTPSTIGSFSHTLTCVGTGGSTLLSTVVAVTAPPPPPFAEGMVSFTLDDAWESQYVNALPILDAAGFKATFYMPSAPIQQGWDLFMTPAMVLDIVRKGHEIGGHTVSHPDLTSLTPAAVTAELTDSRNYLRALTGQPLTAFASPYGRSNASVRALLRQAGFTTARGVNYDTQNSPVSDKLDLRAVCVDTAISFETLKAQILAAKANRSWYILCLHEVKLNGDDLSMTPARFQELVDFVRLSGVRVVTIEQGLVMMAN